MVRTTGRREFRGRSKVVIVPEVHLLTKTPDGASFLDYIARVGRALGASLVLDTQDPASILKLPGLVEQITTLFAFSLRSREQVDSLLELLGRPQTPPYQTLVRGINTAANGKSIRHGHCIMRDRWDEVATVQIDIPSQRVAELLRTTPESEHDLEPAQPIIAPYVDPTPSPTTKRTSTTPACRSPPPSPRPGRSPHPRAGPRAVAAPPTACNTTTEARTTPPTPTECNTTPCTPTAPRTTPRPLPRSPKSAPAPTVRADERLSPVPRGPHLERPRPPPPTPLRPTNRPRRGLRPRSRRSRLQRSDVPRHSRRRKPIPPGPRQEGTRRMRWPRRLRTALTTTRISFIVTAQVALAADPNTGRPTPPASATSSRPRT